MKRFYKDCERCCIKDAASEQTCRSYLARLFIYKGDEHKQSGQKPVEIKF